MMLLRRFLPKPKEKKTPNAVIYQCFFETEKDMIAICDMETARRIVAELMFYEQKLWDYRPEYLIESVRPIITS